MPYHGLVHQVDPLVGACENNHVENDIVFGRRCT